MKCDVYGPGVAQAQCFDDLTRASGPKGSLQLHSYTSIINNSTCTSGCDLGLLQACQHQMGFLYCLNDHAPSFLFFSFIGTIS